MLNILGKRGHRPVSYHSCFSLASRASVTFGLCDCRQLHLHVANNDTSSSRHFHPALPNPTSKLASLTEESASRQANYLGAATWLLSVSFVLVHSRRTNTEGSNLLSRGARPQGQGTFNVADYVAIGLCSFAIVLDSEVIQR